MYISFIIIGCVFTAILFFIQRLLQSQQQNRANRNKFIYWPILILLLVSFGLILYTTKSGQFLDQQRWYNKSPYFQIMLFIFMVMGMFSQYFYNAILERRRKIAKQNENNRTRKRKKPRIEFDIWEFSLPMFISVITFGSLLSQIEDERLTISNVILSYQTGFFWQTILKRNVNQS